MLTTLAALEPNLDRAALATLPFLVRDSANCANGMGRIRGGAKLYRAQAWDKTQLSARITQAGVWARQHDMDATARLAWHIAAWHAFEAQGFGWALWGWATPWVFTGPARHRPSPYWTASCCALWGCVKSPRLGSLAPARL
ncbi:MAG: hypothetical protein EXR01_01395 [Acetobacteraceae bacterium]|nr:hypothetical protein [Acetobacteraceae bacterium]